MLMSISFPLSSLPFTGRYTSHCLLVEHPHPSIKIRHAQLCIALNKNRPLNTGWVVLEGRGCVSPHSSVLALDRYVVHVI